MVVRNSFKWFHTDPHFHDDRVEWWYGDATKSLMLLPKEYLNSFDYVMVDVSETGESIDVIDHLDIFNAMSLLVKPDGIMVKNEPYFDKMSQSFDYAVDVHFYHNPLICDQSMILGSNHIDFFHHDDLTDHGVENLFLPEIEDYPHPYMLWRDYKNTDPNQDGSCHKLEKAIQHQKEDDGARKGKSEGVAMIVEVEHCTIPMKDVESIVVATLKSLGYTSILSDDNTEDGFDVIVMTAQGYVVARRWPKYNYVALDIHIWSRFERLDDTRAALVKALGGGNDVKMGSVSSFRVVTSGMYGNSSWEEDRKLTGPDLAKHTRKCHGVMNVTGDIDADGDNSNRKEDPESPSSAAALEEAVDAVVVKTALDAVMNNMATKDSAVLVFCGLQDQPCAAEVALRHNEHVAQVIPIHMCAKMSQIGEKLTDDDDLLVINKCRQQTVLRLHELLGGENRIVVDAVILDGDAPHAMARLFYSMWTFRQSMVQIPTIHLLVSMRPNSNRTPWRRNVISELLDKLEVDPLTHSALSIKPKGSSRQGDAYEFHILSVDVDDAFQRLRHVEERILLEHGSAVDVIPEGLKGGILRYLDMDEFDPVSFSRDDYDLSAAKQQLRGQLSLGRQSIFQLECADEGKDSSPSIEAILMGSLAASNLSPRRIRTYYDRGEGTIVVARCAGGHAIGMWDGRNHITINLFQFDQRRSQADICLNACLEMAGDGWQKQLRDDMPRGIRKVINFAAELV